MEAILFSALKGFLSGMAFGLAIWGVWSAFVALKEFILSWPFEQ